MESKMGKMLEVFKQANARTSPPADPNPVRPAKTVVAEPQELEAQDKEIPFIEVGGRNAAMEASPAVLASTPTANARSVAVATCRETVYRTVRLDLAASQPRWFTFQPQFAPELIAVHDPRHAVSAQYKAMLNQILGPIATKPTLVVWILGSAPRCGTTTVVLNLALTAARMTESLVTVVEANAARPAMARLVRLPEAAESVAWFQANKPANLRIVTRTDSSQRSFGASLEMLQAEEGLILVDGPSLNDMPIGLSLAELSCDAVYGVSSSGRGSDLTCVLGRPMDGWIISQ
jgi:hypothetical protein